ncbi:glycoside hydrolase family 3 C-terminal domain-containing protein [Halosquirtibacter laminarini]|uniref:Glycoside hydrolase family 3 C-terminal domain-containing protein n=1 Tax=Halosquirtibacter laminarini TaxID=3374600 RepID=A0AC61NHF2_9BACT|nr:glycoside hydrolase family 3 C-terminal domain-containing protein [Prolixibacteraceae bacterium]
MKIYLYRKLILSLLLLVVSSSLVSAQEEQDIETKIDQILSQLTLEEKVKLCHAQSKFSVPGVARLGIPELWMSDGPHGVRAEISWDSWKHAGWTNDSCTAFPALTALASTFNPALSREFGVAIGEEARYRHKDVLLGPGVNIYRTPLNGRNFEYMGEDPFLASTMVVPYIHGVQQNKVAACVKHYALNNQEVLRNEIDVVVDKRALHEIYLPAFKAAVVQGKVWSIMGAYNKYEGVYCCENKSLNIDILKRKWGFDGVVISDWAAAHSTKGSALYGLDIEMGTGTNGLTTSVANSYDSYYLATPLLKMLQNGQIEESVVNDKARRVLRLMMRTTMVPNRPYGSKGSKAHFDVARKVAEEGMILLRNQNNTLPIDEKSNIKIAVIGQNAVKKMTLGGGSSELKAIHEISPLQGIKDAFPEATVTHTFGYTAGETVYDVLTYPKENQDSLAMVAINQAKEADMVIFVGGLNKNYQQDCENGDRTGYNLPYNQDQLIENIANVNSNVVVVLVSGNAVAMPWRSDVKAIVQAWYSGSETGSALGNILSGKVNPSGKLPITFPKQLDDSPAHTFGKQGYPGIAKKVYYKEGILVGYRWFDTKKIDPLYCFGYGLSYTNFKMDKIHSDRKSYDKEDVITVKGEIENTGKVSGSEVIQVYVEDVKSSVLKPLQELKGFKKIKLNPLEKKTFQIKIPVSSLNYYDADNEKWVVESGRYRLRVGTSSRDIIKNIYVEVK